MTSVVLSIHSQLALPYYRIARYPSFLGRIGTAAGVSWCSEFCCSGVRCAGRTLPAASTVPPHPTSGLLPVEIAAALPDRGLQTACRLSVFA